MLRGLDKEMGFPTGARNQDDSLASLPATCGASCGWRSPCLVSMTGVLDRLGQKRSLAIHVLFARRVVRCLQKCQLVSTNG